MESVLTGPSPSPAGFAIDFATMFGPYGSEAIMKSRGASDVITSIQRRRSSLGGRGSLGGAKRVRPPLPYVTTLKVD
jgi:hypothetical protein